MPQQELLKQVVAALDQLGIDYMVTGSVASSLQGEPRSTHDIDLVVSFPASAADALVTLFSPPDYFLSRDGILDAIRGKSMFNLLSVNEDEKVDFWMLTDDPFDRSRFGRKNVEVVFGVKLKVSAPEDTILAKLRWAKLSGGSEKQFTDALRIYELQGPKLDRKYLDSWAAQLGVEDLWEQLKSAAEPI